MQTIEKTFKANNDKFEYFIQNIINPTRIALFANEINK